MSIKLIRPFLLFYVEIIFLHLVACKKSTPGPYPEMEYINLNNSTVKQYSLAFGIDLDHNGTKDLFFKTQLVGDPIQQVDKLQFLVSSDIQTNLPVNVKEEVPVMKFGDLIAPLDFKEYRWFEISSIVLTQKITSITAPPKWEGLWINASHNYLPFQIIMNHSRYNGWVELSFDIQAEQVILHKAALSKDGDKSILAGN